MDVGGCLSGKGAGQREQTSGLTDEGYQKTLLISRPRHIAAPKDIRVWVLWWVILPAQPIVSRFPAFLGLASVTVSGGGGNSHPHGAAPRSGCVFRG